MKLSYQHLVKKIPSEPSIEEISDRLFQLGHENEIDEEIIEIRRSLQIEVIAFL